MNKITLHRNLITLPGFIVKLVSRRTYAESRYVFWHQYTIVGMERQSNYNGKKRSEASAPVSTAGEKGNLTLKARPGPPAGVNLPFGAPFSGPEF
jgi:hypothetical protein